MRLGILHVEALRSALLELSQLADKVESQSADCADAMLCWLRATEDLCKHLNLAATGDLAALRTQLSQAGRGVASSQLAIVGKVTRRKIRAAALSHALARSNEVIQGAIRGRAEQLDECERIAGQVAAVADVKGYIAATRLPGGHDAQLAALEALIRADPDLLSAWTHLVGMAGVNDAKILLDRMIP